MVDRPAFVREKIRLVPTRRGGLQVWEHPQPGLLYVAGVDTSSGGPKGDPASLSMIETRSRALVAAWNGRYDPTEWGRKCAQLAFLYNYALLAFETFPSLHGQSACLAARAAGYPYLYRRRQIGTLTQRVTEEFGWATTDRTKALMIDRVRSALAEGYRIPSEPLLRQFLQAKRVHGGSQTSKVQFDDHDDFYTSYAIAQLVADDVADQGYVSKGEARPLTWEQQWWQLRKQQGERAGECGPKRPRMNDGC